MNQHRIGHFTGEIVRVDFNQLKNPQERDVVADHKPLLDEVKKIFDKVKREVKYFDEIQNGAFLDPVRKSTQLESIRKKLESIKKRLEEIEQDADVKIKATDQRKVNSRQSQDIMLDVLAEIETELAQKKASAIYIHKLAHETRKKVETALERILIQQ